MESNIRMYDTLESLRTQSLEPATRLVKLRLTFRDSYKLTVYPRPDVVNLHVIGHYAVFITFAITHGRVRMVGESEEMMG